MSLIPSVITILQTRVYLEQLQLLHQAQSHALPFFNMFLLYILLHIPIISIEWKLWMYNFLTSPNLAFLSMLKLSPLVSGIIIAFYPLFLLGVFFLFFYLLIKFINLFMGIIRLVVDRMQKVQPKIFLELTFPQDTTKSPYATEQLYTLLHSLARQKSTSERFPKEKKTYSLEIVSTRNEGIRYILVVPRNESEIIKRSLLSYLPAIRIKEVGDYLADNSLPITSSSITGVIEVGLSSHFALPLTNQKTLSEHDPIAYLTGTMTKLTPSELISFQIVATPVLSSLHTKIIKEMNMLQGRIRKGKPLSPKLHPDFLQKLESLPVINIVWPTFKFLSSLVRLLILFIISIPSAVIDTDGKSVPILSQEKVNLQEILNPYEQELQGKVLEKMSQHLFETTLRFLVVAKDKNELESRVSGLMSSLGQFTNFHQSLISIRTIPFLTSFNKRMAQFKRRVLSINLFAWQNSILSASELSDLYHFPYTDTTKTEGLVKLKSRELPTPLSFKKSTTHLDVVVGKNTYGGEETLVGLTPDQRREHTYIVGKTGMGKTTIIKKMAYQDIVAGKGLAVIDPHGDMVKELLRVIPESRKKDVIYLDPTDKGWPVGLNILAPGDMFVDEEEAADWITGSVISVFMKITPKANWGQRMEHILRNATMTALTTESPTLMTIQKLLTNKAYQRSISATLTDPVLKQFWNDEFKLYGSMQKADVISPLTNKLGEFITSKMSRHILLQEKSTIKLSEVMDEGKVLLVNLSKGSLGEERSIFFGTLIISLIQLATYQRAQIPESERRDFFLYIDEFQNFATPHFADIFSEARKFHLYIIPSHQNIAQIDEVKTAKVVLGNSGTIISLKNGPDDEEVILPFMEPEVEKGEIVNLPPHHFFMKVTNQDPEDAFSGETTPLKIEGSDKIARFIIDSTREHYATPRALVEKQLRKLFGVKDEKDEEQIKGGAKSGQESGKNHQKHGFRSQTNL